jgi:O-antigen biosynthesis protein
METNLDITDWFSKLLKTYKSEPLISLVMPVYNTKEEWLRECINSVLTQEFPYWELCICNNGSFPYVDDILRYYVANDPRIKVVTLAENHNGAEGTNVAINISTGEYIGFLDSDDILMPTALTSIAQYIDMYYGVKILYTDEIFMTSSGVVYLPFFKPNFNANLLCLIPYFGHLTVYERSIVTKLMLRYSGGSYDYDLALRASKMTEGHWDICHIDEILYKYRIYPESTSHTLYQSCVEGGLKSLQEYLDEVKPGAKARIEDNRYKVLLPSGEDLKINSRGLIKPYDSYPYPQHHVLSQLENY